MADPRQRPWSVPSREAYEKWDEGPGAPIGDPGGMSGDSSRSYWNRRPTGPGGKYWHQRPGHGAFDELGFTETIPEGGVAPWAQFESERIVAQRNARLMERAHDTIGDARDNSLSYLESHRPGGAAAMTSGIHMQAGMGMANMLAASRTEAPDLLYQNRRDTARRAAQKARQMQYIQLGVQTAATLGAAAIAPAGGAGAAAITAAGNMGTAAINANNQPQVSEQGTPTTKSQGVGTGIQPINEPSKPSGAGPGPAGPPQTPQAQQAPGGQGVQGPQPAQQGGGQGPQEMGGGGQGGQGGQGPQGPQQQQGGAPGGAGPQAGGAATGGAPLGPLTPEGQPIGMPSSGGGDPADMCTGRILRDAEASGLDTLAMRAFLDDEDDADRDDFLGFINVWNADIDALLYAG